MAEGAPDWTKAVKIYGVDEDGNVVGVLLNPQGRMEALMKGAYDSVLKTLATDDVGRLMAVITDPAGIWGNRPELGLGELAARLGSPVNYERRGSVIFQDSFEEGLIHCIPRFVEGDGLIELVSDNVLIGGYSAYLDSGETEDYESYLEYQVSPPSLDKPFGIEFHWARGVNVVSIELKVQVRGPEPEGHAGIKLEPGTGDIFIENPVGTWLPLYGRYASTEFTHYWHAIKLVIDPGRGMYDRIYVDEDVHEGIHAEYPETATSSDPRVTFQIIVHGQEDWHAYAWIDSVIFTTNEEATNP